MTDYTAQALRHAAEVATDSYMERNIEKVANVLVGALLGAGVGAAAKVRKLHALSKLAPEAEEAIYRAANEAVKKGVKKPGYILSPAEAAAKRNAEILHGSEKFKKLKPSAPSLSLDGKGPGAMTLAGESLARRGIGLARNNPQIAAGASDVLRSAIEGGIAGGATGGAIKAFSKHKKRQAMRTLAKTVALPAAGGLTAAALLARRD